MKTETKVLLVLVLVIAYAFYTAVGVFAMSIESNQVVGHGGDCGYELYPVTESGASGYCYVSQTKSMQSLAVTVAEPVKHDEPEIEPAPVCEASEYHPCH